MLSVSILHDKIYTNHLFIELEVSSNETSLKFYIQTGLQIIPVVEPL